MDRRENAWRLPYKARLGLVTEDEFRAEMDGVDGGWALPEPIGDLVCVQVRDADGDLIHEGFMRAVECLWESDGLAGESVVELLEAARKSMTEHGSWPRGAAVVWVGDADGSWTLAGRYPK